MRTPWQKSVERRLAALEEMDGIDPERDLSPIGIEIRDGILFILTDHGQVRLDAESRTWLAAKIETMDEGR